MSGRAYGASASFQNGRSVRSASVRPAAGRVATSLIATFLPRSPVLETHVPDQASVPGAAGVLGRSPNPQAEATSCRCVSPDGPVVPVSGGRRARDGRRHHEAGGRLRARTARRRRCRRAAPACPHPAPAGRAGGRLELVELRRAHPAVRGRHGADRRSRRHVRGRRVGAPPQRQPVARAAPARDGLAPDRLQAARARGAEVHDDLDDGGARGRPDARDHALHAARGLRALAPGLPVRAGPVLRDPPAVRAAGGTDRAPGVPVRRPRRLRLPRHLPALPPAAPLRRHAPDTGLDRDRRPARPARGAPVGRIRARGQRRPRHRARPDHADGREGRPRPGLPARGRGARRRAAHPLRGRRPRARRAPGGRAAPRRGPRRLGRRRPDHLDPPAPRPPRRAVQRRPHGPAARAGSARRLRRARRGRAGPDPRARGEPPRASHGALAPGAGERPRARRHRARGRPGRGRRRPGGRRRQARERDAVGRGARRARSRSVGRARRRAGGGLPGQPRPPRRRARARRAPREPRAAAPVPRPGQPAARPAARRPRRLHDGGGAARRRRRAARGADGRLDVRRPSRTRR